MRIGLVCEDFRANGFGGGISRYCDMLAPALAGLGHEVHILTMPPRGQGHSVTTLSERVCRHDIPQYNPRLPGWRTLYWQGVDRAFPGYCFNLSWGVPLGRYVLRLARERQLDLVEVPETGGRLAWHVHAVRRHIPVVVRLHAPSILTAASSRGGQDRYLRQLCRMERRLILGASAVNAPSRAVVEFVENWLARPFRDVAIIPNPSSVPDARHEGAAAVGRRRILFVGRLEPLKGIDVMIRAFVLLRQRHPDVHLDLVGPDSLATMGDGGNTRALVEAYAPGAGTDDLCAAIHWHGPKPQAEADTLRVATSCVVVPSRFENFSYALLEAMALGCPVVASRAGGLQEMIQDGRNGLLFEAGSDAGLAATIERLITNPDEAARLGAAARQAVETRYHADRVAADIAAWYSANLAGAAPAHPSGTYPIAAGPLPAK